MTAGRPRWLDRAMAVGLLTLIVGSMLALTIPALANWWAQTKAEANAEQRKLAKLKAHLRAGPEVAAALDEAAGADVMTEAFLPGGGESRANALLQAEATALVREAGGKLESLETLPGKKDERVFRPRLQVAFEIGYGDLLNLLQDLDKNRPILIVEQLRLRSFETVDRRDLDLASSLKATLAISALQRLEPS
ncbi:MAG: type II secretion system protein GspM [Geminicoccaceae bacterium]